MIRLLAVVPFLVLGLGLLAPAPADAATGTTTAAVLRPVAPDVAPARRLVQRDMEDRILALTNQQRVSNGCRALRPSKHLRRAARRHTVTMARAGVMSHQLPGEASFSARISRAGYRGWSRVAENIARGFSSPEAVMTAWMESPGHRQNILNCRLRELGVGVVLSDDQLWWTQDFGRR
ncbi:CAP domain-containing protein [Nocardioides albidus]|uniref:CAP domain-containing protein n=1 Tax=Nocardioides albidus TaxID=1517589 RepID=A0A5C4VRS1_9ACTN|nr:CAP domain-containing protein [Nocardioides albidus]TNM38255.1 CAP domain-containing protein [Nocardioides albidus]